MKLEDITADQIDVWLNNQFDRTKTQTINDDWLAIVSMALEDMSSIARTKTFTEVLVTLSVLRNREPKAAILAFGICLGIEFATDTMNNAKEDVKCQILQ